MTEVEFGEQLDATWSPRSRPPPELLFHYTSVDGLKGIVESGELFATHVAFTNDSRELQHGDPLIRAAFESCRGSAGLLGEKLIDRFLEKPLRIREDFEIFVTCFSETPDSLTQWRSYASDGRGYALAFQTIPNIEGLPWCCGVHDDGVGGSGHAVDLFPVIYTTELARDQLGQQVRAVVDVVDRASQFLDHETILRVALGRIRSLAASLSIRLKHEAFESEHEWRLTVLKSPSAVRPEVFLRPRRDLLAPTVRLRLGPEEAPLPLRSVHVGPVHTVQGTHLAAAQGVHALMRSNWPAVRLTDFVIWSRLPYAG